MRHVLDASAVVDVLVGSERGARVRAHLGEQPIAPLSVAHLDAEVLQALARIQRAGLLAEHEVTQLLTVLGDLRIKRLPITGELLSAAWALRHNVMAKDALYVAAAAAADAGLVTTDDRLARAVPGLAVEL